MYFRRKFIRGAAAHSPKVDLHKRFAEWVTQEGLTLPTEEQWKEIMEEDCRLLHKANHVEKCCRYMHILYIELVTLPCRSHSHMSTAAVNTADDSEEETASVEVDGQVTLDSSSPVSPSASFNTLGSLSAMDIRSIFFP